MVSLSARSHTGLEWRDQIQSIIAETERNLGMKARDAPKPFVPSRPAPNISYSPGAYLSCSSYGAAAGGLGMAGGLGAAASAAAAGAAYTAEPPAVIDASAGLPQIPSVPLAAESSVEARASQARLLESVKFELEVRGSLAQKELHAVRDEMHASMTSTEKKWVDMAKQREASLDSRIEAETKLRKLTEEKVQQLRDAASQYAPHAL